MTRWAVSSLIGSIGYLTGNWYVAGEGKLKIEQPAAKLLTVVPTRTTSAVGHLWDEGFHQLLLQRWSPSLSLKIITSWLNLMDDYGWIARQQILGFEARERLDGNLHAQRSEEANPPTLVVLALDTMINRHLLPAAVSSGNFSLSASLDAPLAPLKLAKSDGFPATLLAFLKEAYPRLVAHYDWFIRTQAGAVSDTFRWRGRAGANCIASGMRDYPRALKPSDEELHLDLQVWMIMFSRSMEKISRILGNLVDARFYAAKAAAQFDRLDEYFWDSNHHMYLDVESYVSRAHVLHEGYVSLFPFMFGLIPEDSPRLYELLERLVTEQTLYSIAGIRSLSASDMQYSHEKDADWRGSVWINMNYLLLRALRRVSVGSGPFAGEAGRLFRHLSKSIGSAMFSAHVTTGAIWEQYNGTDGEGKGAKPFTGWSALVASIVAEHY
jgi:mannosyl-oligosaccharide glucosidase